MTPRVIIAGCGFGGLTVAESLDKKSMTVTAIDSREFFTYTPALPEIISGKSHHKKISLPLAPFLTREGVTFLHDTITELDPPHKFVRTKKQELRYDYLVLALGSVTNYYSIPGHEHCVGFKSLKDASVVRKRLTDIFERTAEQGKAMTVSIVGAGATGVEVAVEVQERLKELCRVHDTPEDAVRVMLIEADRSVLPGYAEDLGSFVHRYLEKKKIVVRCSSPVTRIEESSLTLARESLPMDLLIWTAGIKAHPLVALSGLPVHRSGALVVNEYLQSVADPSVFGVGDNIAYQDAAGRSSLATAVHAIQEGMLAARNIHALHTGRRLLPYSVKQRPMIISLGDDKAIFSSRHIDLKGLKSAYQLKKFVQWHYLWRLT